MRIISNVFLTAIFLFTTKGFSQEGKTEDVLRFSMKTKWTDQVNDTDLWNNYPRPQLDRGEWTNLNGLWDYAITPVTDKLPTNYDGKIRVPFPVESELSKVKKMVGPEKLLWYRTSFSKGELAGSERIHLNFGAVDWEAVIYLNGKLAGSHKGGYTAFSIDITPFLGDGDRQELVVKVWDPTDAGTQARGKQVRDPQGIWYTPVTGIWQTVWLEKTNKDFIGELKAVADIDKSIVALSAKLPMASTALKLTCTVKDNGKTVATEEINVTPGSGLIGLELPIPNRKLWSPENPFLYDLEVSLKTESGKIVDQVKSYFGMRKIALGKDANGHTRMLLNHKPVFQFGLLDQGWWPDGLYTPPTEEAMMYDVEMTKKWGFNMLRKHVKVEPARYYYNCDKMGMLVWQDMPNGNYFQDLRVAPDQKQDAERPHVSAIHFEKELREMIDQFSFSPSIVIWVPFNEGWGQYDTERIAAWTQNYDPTRLCDAPSGWADRNVGDLIDTHIYPGPGMEDPEHKRASVVGEFGGLGWPVKDHMWWDKRNWGYLTFQDRQTLEKRFAELIDDLIGLKSQGLSGAIYTQTTDVEGEVNGLMTYDRELVKIDPKITQKLFAPLYEQAWKERTLLSDSEQEPEMWKVSFGDTSTDWHTPDFDDSGWENSAAPFSSFENFFLPMGSKWASENTLYARKAFYLDRVPSEINLNYFLHRASMELYINGKKVKSLEHEGGRQRHYANKLIKGANSFLKAGRNTVAVVVKAQEKECSFDMGLYEAGLLNQTSDLLNRPQNEDIPSKG